MKVYKKNGLLNLQLKSTRLKRVRKSNKYKYISLYITKDGVEKWGVKAMGNNKYFDNERDAAIEVDKRLIKINREPVNLLKRIKD